MHNRCRRTRTIPCPTIPPLTYVARVCKKKKIINFDFGKIIFHMKIDFGKIIFNMKKIIFVKKIMMKILKILTQKTYMYIIGRAHPLRCHQAAAVSRGCRHGGQPPGATLATKTHPDYFPGFFRYKKTFCCI